MTAPEQPGVLAYLAVPPVVAGVRFGLLTATNATLVAAAASVVTVVVSSDPDERRAARPAPPCGCWLGYGVGLLASWQLRSVRDIEARQAPYAAANQLMSQLHQLAQRGRLGLDSAQLAVELETALRTATGAESSAVFVIGADDSVGLLASHGDAAALFALRDQLAQSGSTAARRGRASPAQRRQGPRQRAADPVVRVDRRRALRRRRRSPTSSSSASTPPCSSTTSG